MRHSNINSERFSKLKIFFWYLGFFTNIFTVFEPPFSCVPKKTPLHIYYPPASSNMENQIVRLMFLWHLFLLTLCTTEAFVTPTCRSNRGFSISADYLSSLEPDAAAATTSVGTDDDRPATLKLEPDAAAATTSVGTDDDTPATLKSKIFAACAAADRGYAASPSDRRNIEKLLLDLSTLSPPVEPTVGLNEGSSSSPLKACWRLVYTSASDVRQRCEQDIH
jgi:hypothetical protein